MASNETEGLASAVAVFGDHASAEDAVGRLQRNGIPMQNVSIMGKDFQAVEKPLGFVLGIAHQTVEPGCLLIVDDDEDNRAMLRRYLEPKGFHVVEADDGVQALAWLAKEPCDVVLLDIMMPGVGGLEVLRRLRQTYSMTSLPVIMATARDKSRDVVEALRLGANDYLTKPFDFPVALARVQTQLSVRRANEALTRANRRMKSDLEAAAYVQQSLLPPKPLQLPGLGFAWEFSPCDELGGDLLGVVDLNAGRVALYLLDVSGHGVKAAMLAVMVNRVLAQQKGPSSSGQLTRGASWGDQLTPAEVAAHLNRTFPWNDETQQFFTLLYGILDLGTGEFRFTAAGHPGPIYLPRDGAGRHDDVPGFAIGMGDGDYQESVLVMKPGDRLYLYSDGLPDAMSAEGKGFGKDRLLAALEGSRALPLQDGVTDLFQGVQRWCRPNAPHDDISMLAIEFREATPGEISQRDRGCFKESP